MILRDPEAYPDPEGFNPERFLNKDGSLRDDPRLALVFGTGRRICPGREFVDSATFITAASVISAFNLTNAKDENGQDIPVNVTPTLQREVLM